MSNIPAARSIFKALDEELSQNWNWALVRNYVNDVLAGGEPSLQKPLSNKFLLFFRRLRGAWFFKPFGGRVLFVGNSGDVVLADKQYTHRLFHSLIKEFGEEKTFLLIKGASPSSKFSNVMFVEFLATLLAKIMAPFVKSNELQVRLNKDGLTISTAGIISYHQASYSLWKFIFSIYKPRALFISDISNAFNMGLIRAAHANGIRVFEVQHGLINPEHVTYFYHSNLNNKNLVPNELLCYGSYFQDFFKRSNAAYTRENVSAIGHPALDLISLNANVNSEPMLLATLQDPLCDDLYNVVVSLAKRHPQIKFICLPRNKIPHTSENLPNLLIAPPGTFYDLIPTARAHMTAYSTTAYEALHFGVPNILFNINGTSLRYLSDLIKTNDFTQVSDTVDGASAQLEKFVKTDRKQIIKSADYLFSNSHHERVRDFLKSRQLIN